jgi:uncharacterized beta-barrel protein YwiB (DUF1934 family)
MMSNTIEFADLSTDPDSYTISFSQRTESQKESYGILTEAIQYRINQIVEENELKVLGFTLKVDCFEFTLLRQGYIEMDSLFHSESVTVVDAYLYDHTNALKAKASCTLQYEKVKRVPAY